MLRKAWMTDHSGNHSKLAVLSLESGRVPLSVQETSFPEDKPRRHVVTIGMLSDEDAIEIIEALENWLLRSEK
jgi:hypothetical protein